MRRRRRNPARRNSTPEGTVIGLAATGGMIASLYYAATAIGTFNNTDEARRRAVLSGVTLIGSIGLLALGGTAAEKVRARRALVA